MIEKTRTIRVAVDGRTLLDQAALAWTADMRAAWEEQNRLIAENIMAAARRDYGRRVLVAVQCQRIHKLEPLLRQHEDELEIVNYWEL